MASGQEKEGLMVRDLIECPMPCFAGDLLILHHLTKKHKPQTTAYDMIRNVIKMRSKAD